MKTEMGVVIFMYLNIPEIILIPIIYGFMGLIALHRERKRCGQVGPSPRYSQSQVMYT